MDIPIFIVKKIMAIDNLFQRIKNSVRSQKSSFCSTSTSVTLLGSGQFIPLNLVVSYTDCDGIQRVVSYQEVLGNNNYIPDCVQGGCPISITNGGETTSTLISDINEGDVLIEPKPIEPQQSSYKIFVQYGTTPCVTPTPTPTVTFPTSTPTPTLPTYFSYIVGDTSYNNQIDACASSGGGTITVYSSTNKPIVNSTFLYTDSLLTTPYNSESFVYYSGKGNSVLSTGSDGKLTSLSICT